MTRSPKTFSRGGFVPVLVSLARLRIFWWHVETMAPKTRSRWYCRGPENYVSQDRPQLKASAHLPVETFRRRENILSIPAFTDCKYGDGDESSALTASMMVRPDGHSSTQTAVILLGSSRTLDRNAKAEVKSHSSRKESVRADPVSSLGSIMGCRSGGA